MQKKFLLYFAFIVCASSVQVNAAKLSTTKKTHTFQRDQWLSKRDALKSKKSKSAISDNRYELQISPSHTVKNSAFQLREKIDIDQATIHEGRTATKAAAHFDAEGA